MLTLVGRTARMGNHGLATSFYNDRNSDIGEDLTKILIENDQPVPDFLEQYRPDGELTWDEPSEDDEPTVSNDNGGAAPGEFDADAGDAW
jgi:ATP-dependent RNA helicase DDX3X